MKKKITQEDKIKEAIDNYKILIAEHEKKTEALKDEIKVFCKENTQMLVEKIKEKIKYLGERFDKIPPSFYKEILDIAEGNNYYVSFDTDNPSILEIHFALSFTPITFIVTIAEAIKEGDYIISAIYTSDIEDLEEF